MKKKTCGELDIKKYYLDGRLFIKILVVYLAVVIFFYIAASHQILYTAHNQEALPDEETTEAVTDDRAVKQIFSYDGDYLRAICIKIGTYARKNTGYLKVSLKNIADDSILWHSSYDVAQFDDNAWHQMNIGICLPQDSSRYCLDFSSEGCYEGNAITFYTCTAQDSQDSEIYGAYYVSSGNEETGDCKEVSFTHIEQTFQIQEQKLNSLEVLFWQWISQNGNLLKIIWTLL